MNHKGGAKTIAFEKRLKGLRHGNRALISILRTKRGRLLYVNQLCLYVEPIGASFDNFVLTESGVKTAEEDKFQVLSFTLADQLVTQRWRAKIAPPLRIEPRQFHIFHDVFPHLPRCEKSVKKTT